MGIDPKHIIQDHGKDHVLYAGLLDEAHRQGLKSIETELLQAPTAENGMLAICKAVVETAAGRFSGIGDAAPHNVNKMIVPHLVRMAETRAKARALRDALNIDMVAVEELMRDDSPDADGDSAAASRRQENGNQRPANNSQRAAPPRRETSAARDAPANGPACPLHGAALIRSKEGAPGHWNGEKDVTGWRPWCGLSEVTQRAYEQLLHDWGLDAQTVDAKLESSDLRKPWHIMTPEQQLAALPRLRTWAEARVKQAAGRA